MSERTQSLSNAVHSDIQWIIQNYSVPWQKLKGKTILISGAAGFLAAYMIETLLYLNVEHGLDISIFTIVRDKSRFFLRFPHLIQNSKLTCIEQDVKDPILINCQIDFIVHAASPASPKYYATDPVGTLSANTAGTAHLLNLARQNNSEGFLFFSSAEVYGEPSQVPTAENDYGYMDPLAIRSCYAESKRMGENMCVAWNHQFGVPARIVRPFHTYGPGMNLTDGRIYADIVSDVVHKRDILLKSDGSAKRAFCYLADATAGFWLVLLQGQNAKAYNIGDPNGLISIRDLATLVSEIMPERKISVRFEQRDQSEKYLSGNITVTCPDISLAAELGWKPYTSLKDGFRKTIESYLP